MNLCKVKNVTASRLVILAVRERDGQPITFEPGECKQMMPATVNHPAVSVHIGRGLQLVEAQIEEVKEVPKTKVLEVAISPAPPPAPKVEAPVVEPVVEAPVIQEAPATPVGSYAHAPGITESNYSAILEEYPTLADLAIANKDMLTKIGMTKYGAKKLIAWAAAELGNAVASDSDDSE
jgi:hypothetical protein